MAIEFHQENVQLDTISEEKCAEWLEKTILSEGYEVGDINLIFCDDEYLLGLNQQYLKHDYYTDIITFDYTEKKIVSGDLFISLDRVKDNAAQIGISKENELDRVMVHGVLHLCGYKDKNPIDKEVMTNKENYYLQLLNQ